MATLTGDNNPNNISGTADDDSISGLGNADTLNGLGGNDILDGGNGADRLFGGDGQDTLFGGAGGDLLDGGADADTASYAGDGAAINANLSSATNTVTGGAGGTDTLVGIENIIATGFADSIIGSSGDNVIVGGIGGDTIFAGGGNDLIYSGNIGAAVVGNGTESIDAGDGNDRVYVTEINNSASTLDGGAGTDTIYFDFDPASLGGTTLRINIAEPGSLTQPLDGVLGDQFFRNFENVTTGAGADSIVGNSVGNVLTSQGGNDYVDGAGGNDTLYGGDGSDTLLGGANDDVLDGGNGSDTLIGGAGADVLYGGLGTDLADYSGSATGVNVNLTLTGGQSGGDAAGDTLSGVENVTGTNSDDTLIGDGGSNVLTGGLGNDLLGGGGGADALYGGGGIDTADYSTSGAGVSVDLTATGAQSGGDAAGDTLSGVENLTGSGLNDTLTGDGGTNILTGGLGNDTLYGGGGSDTLYGGSGDDALNGGDGADILTGGIGNDRLDGGAGVDAVSGGAGNDTLIGSGQGETLYGGEDRDVFSILGVGSDTILGGEIGDDNDVLDLSSSTFPRSIVFDPGSTQGDLSGTVTFYDPNNPTVILGTLVFDEIEGIICFTPGTLIETRNGPVAVERLREGDWVATRDNGYQQIRWVGRRDLSRLQVARDPSLAPIRIRAGSLGDGLPSRDLTVSPAHRMLLTSSRAQLYFEEPEVLVAAKYLAGAAGIGQQPAQAVSYIHFMFDRHEIVLANGSWSESFLPGDQALRSLDGEQRTELLTLFPDIKDQLQAGPGAARRILKRTEARVLLA